MSEAREHLLDWLRDAHAMEQQAGRMLQARASRIGGHPKMKARIEQHMEETRGQQVLLEGCLERLGSSPSAVKDTVGTLAAMGQGITGMFASDEIVRDAIAGYVFEHLEIASYTVLAAAAHEAGDAGTLRACEQILAQEETMAQWTLDCIPEITQAFMRRDAGEGTEAKE